MLYKVKCEYGRWNKKVQQMIYWDFRVMRSYCCNTDARSKTTTFLLNCFIVPELSRMVMFYLHAHSKFEYESDSDSEGYFAIAPPETPTRLRSSL